MLPGARCFYEQGVKKMGCQEHVCWQTDPCLQLFAPCSQVHHKCIYLHGLLLIKVMLLGILPQLLGDLHAAGRAQAA